jgi:hypothetical protein
MTHTPDDPRLPDPGDPGERPAATGAEPLPAAPPPLDQPARPDGSVPLSPLAPLPPIEDDVTRPRPPWRSARALVAGVAVLVLAGSVALAVAGGEDDSPDGVASVDGSDGADDNDGSSGSSDDERPSDSEMQDAMLEYAECMREHGVDMPDPELSEDGGGMITRREAGPNGGATGVPGDEEWEAAQEACGSIMEDARGSVTPPSPEERAEMQDKLVAMAECMRARGYDMPDPVVGSEGQISIEMRGGPDAGGPDGAGDDQLQEDQEACNEQAGLEGGPMRAGGPGGSSSGAAGEAD